MAAKNLPAASLACLTLASVALTRHYPADEKTPTSKACIANAKQLGAALTRARTAPKRPASSTPNRLVTLLLVIFGVASITALWSILTLISGGFGGYLAIVVAVSIALLLHSFGYPPGFKRAVLALVLMSTSVIYQAYLFAAGTIAGEMGFSLGESAQMIGGDLAFALFRAHVTALELSCYGISLLLAFALGLLLGKSRA
jgi:hypothetical protein